MFLKEFSLSGDPILERLNGNLAPREGFQNRFAEWSEIGLLTKKRQEASGIIVVGELEGSSVIDIPHSFLHLLQAFQAIGRKEEEVIGAIALVQHLK
jgi:hypothetical protein